MNNTCGNCKHFKPDEYERLGGICLLSRTENEFMAARDEMHENRPYLEVSEKFGCNQRVKK